MKYSHRVENLFLIKFFFSGGERDLSSSSSMKRTEVVGRFYFKSLPFRISRISYSRTEKMKSKVKEERKGDRNWERRRLD